MLLALCAVLMWMGEGEGREKGEQCAAFLLFRLKAGKAVWP